MTDERAAGTPDAEPDVLDLFAPAEPGREPEAIDALLARLDDDPRLSAELELAADLAALAERSAARRPAPAPAPRPRRRVLGWTAGLAAAAVVAVGVWLGLGRTEPGGGTPVRTALDRSPPTWMPSLLRADPADGAASLPARLAAAMEPYAAGDWAGAVRALEALLAEAPDNPPARFYLAAALEARGASGVPDDAARARELWAALADEGDDLLARHARWRLALALLEAGRADAARAALARLAEDDGAFAADARALLDADPGRGPR